MHRETFSRFLHLRERTEKKLYIHTQKKFFRLRKVDVKLKRTKKKKKKFKEDRKKFFAPVGLMIKHETSRCVPFFSIEILTAA